MKLEWVSLTPQISREFDNLIIIESFGTTRKLNSSHVVLLPSVLQYCTTEGSGVAGDRESLRKATDKRECCRQLLHRLFSSIFLKFILTDATLFLLGLLEQTTGG